MNREAEYVLRTVEERGIRFIRLWFTDVQGFLKSVSISPSELEVAFEEGMTFDGSAIDGYSELIRREFHEYQVQRAELYAAETRWPASGFWQRRRATG